MMTIAKLGRALLIISLLPALCYGQIYQYRDKDGNLSFTDTPVPGAKEVQVQDIGSVQLAPSTVAPDMTVKPTVTKTKAPEYSRVEITSPLPDETITNGIGLLDVTVLVEPPLQKGDTIVMYVDGLRAGDSANANHFTLHNLDRGMHILQVKVENKDGGVVGSSARTTVHVHRPHLGNRVQHTITPIQMAKTAKG